MGERERERESEYKLCIIYNDGSLVLVSDSRIINDVFALTFRFSQRMSSLRPPDSLAICDISIRLHQTIYILYTCTTIAIIMIA